MSSKMDPFKDQLGLMRMLSKSRRQGQLASKVVKDAFKDIDPSTIQQKEMTVQEPFKNPQLTFHEIEK